MTWGIGRGPIQDLGVGDDPAVGLRQPELAAELDRLTCFVARDDGGVGLDQAHHLLCGGDLLAAKDAPLSLGDHATHQWHQAIQLAHEALRCGI